MTKFLAGVLSVIAIGVMLIAYGLLSPRVGAQGTWSDGAAAVRPMLAGEQIMLRDDPSRSAIAPANMSPYADRGSVTGPSYAGPGASRASGQPTVARQEPRPVSASTAAPSVQHTRVVERAPGRDWKKTALIIGGSTAAGAGLGGIFGGKKGALIGAAIAGGASTIYETNQK